MDAPGLFRLLAFRICPFLPSSCSVFVCVTLIYLCSYTVPPPKLAVRGASSALALQCLADLKDIQTLCIPPLTAAAAAIHPTLCPIVTGLHEALQLMHQIFVKLYAAPALRCKSVLVGVYDPYSYIECRPAEDASIGFDLRVLPSFSR
jgi:hypothetical protein